MIHNKYHGNYGASLPYVWQTDGTAYDENAENLRAIQGEIYDQWGKENLAARDAWWEKADQPNYNWLYNLADWSWTDAQNQLSLARNELVKDKDKSPKTLALWNSLMNADENTKPFAIEVSAASGTATGTESGTGSGTGGEPPKGMNPLIIAGIVGVLGVGVFLFMKSRGGSYSE
jgi:hypothetical protein